MQVSVNITYAEIISAIKKMPLNELEKLKSAIIKREIYFKRFKKDKIQNIIDDFSKEKYSKFFLTDIEDGLKKSSVYNENKKTKK